MKRIGITIIGSVFVLGLLFGVMRGMFGTAVDMQARAEAAKKEAAQMHEMARKATCSFIGSLTADCYDGNGDACALLAQQEDDYLNVYGSEAYLNCPAENVQPIVLQEMQDADPSLFFGDEE